jgi:PAS domain S-box-containing protein
MSLRAGDKRLDFMTDADKTRQQLESELAELRRRAAELVAQATRHQQAETETTFAQGWEQVLDAVPDLIIVTDAHHHVVGANRAMADRLGLTPEEMIGRSCFFCVHGQDQPPANCPLAQWQGGAQAQTTQVYEQRQGGSLAISVTPLYSAEGQLVGSVHVAHDTTERKQAEAVLARHAQELGALYSTSLEINSQRSLPTLLYAIVERAATLLNAHMGGLYTLKPDGETLELVVSYHLPGDYVGTKLRLGEGLSGRVAQTGQPIMIADSVDPIFKSKARRARQSDRRNHTVAPVPSG